jgi:hypothetical protein
MNSTAAYRQFLQELGEKRGWLPGRPHTRLHTHPHKHTLHTPIQRMQHPFFNYGKRFQFTCCVISAFSWLSGGEWHYARGAFSARGTWWLSEGVDRNTEVVLNDGWWKIYTKSIIIVYISIYILANWILQLTWYVPRNTEEIWREFEPQPSLTREPILNPQEVQWRGELRLWILVCLLL